MRVYFIRHGQSHENAADLQRRLFVDEFRTLLSESRDSALTELGIEQAQSVGMQLKEYGLNLLYSSPFPRAFHTAKIIAASTELPVQVVTELHEIIPLVPAVLRKQRSRSLRSLYIRGYLQQLWPTLPHHGETWWTARRRAVNVWTALSQTWLPSSRVAIVSHRAFIWTTLRYLQRYTAWRIVSRDLSNAGVSEVVLE